MQYLIDQAATDLANARMYLAISTREYHHAKKRLGECNKEGYRYYKRYAFVQLNKTRAQLQRDIKAAQNALDWYRSVKLGLLAEYRQTL